MKRSIEEDDENLHSNIENDPASDEPNNKRTRKDAESQLVNYQNANNALIAVDYNKYAGSMIVREANARTSSMVAPEVTLTGHEGAVYSLSFEPTTGNKLCSASMDRKILLWDVFGPEGVKNYNVMSGHKNAVLEVHWSSYNNSNTIISCSADKTVAIWDANKGTRIRKYAEHTGIVNSCHYASKNDALMVSGGDDGALLYYDLRCRESVLGVYQDYQLLSVCCSSDGQTIFSAGIDNIIRRFDTRMIRNLSSKQIKHSNDYGSDMVLSGHTDSITGMSISPDDTVLLSNSMDCTLRSWNLRPFINNDHSNSSRCEKVVRGVHHGAEKLLLKCSFSADQEYFSAGSADRTVHLWDASSGNEICGWPTHKASVNQVIFHPKEPILASCSSDKTIILGEFVPQ